MGKKKPNPTEQVAKTAQQRYETTTQPTANEQAMGGLSDTMNANYGTAVAENTKNYGDIMGAYNKFRSDLGGPTKFGFQNVNAEQPKELGESYGYLREAAPGYREFAQTGGYSPQDIQELRARGIGPIRSAYGNTMMEMDRARSLGGGDVGAPNYIAAASKAQRELPGQMADAMTGVNASLADAIRQGRLAGLGGLSGIGQTMGGLSSADASRMLQAQISNQGADIQTQGMGEQSLQNIRGNQLASMSGQTGLYNATPGMSSMFGNQALNSMQGRAAMEQARNQFGLNLLDEQLRAQQLKQQQVPWWQKALSIGGQIAPYALAPFTGGASLLATPATSQLGKLSQVTPMGQVNFPTGSMHF